MAETIVVALGGNALGKAPEEQLELVKGTAGALVDLVEQGYRVVVGHGNGPQVGIINNAMTYSAEKGGNTPAMPFAECGAMSQGYIGYHLQQALQNELKKRGIRKMCAAVVTQVVVSAEDPGFRNPTKPVGVFYTKDEAEALARKSGDTYVEDAGRGYRKVVASPVPVRIEELELVRTLVENDALVITVGGGGIPVIETETGLSGVSAVIDKDNSCSRLATDLDADRLVILTAVEKVCINFNRPDQKALSRLTLEEARKYIEEGQFAKGSMLPKIEACIRYVEATGKEALITSLQAAKDGLAGKTGTVICKDQ